MFQALQNPPQPTRPQRVLACVLCQQRKVKCDRKYPCANCIKYRAQCIPATQVPRQRKRRVQTRDLLDRIRKYEDLLSRNNIQFEPLQKTLPGDEESPSVDGFPGVDEESQKMVARDWSSPSTSDKSERVFEAKDMWQAMNDEFRSFEDNSDESDVELPGTVIKKSWDHLYEDNDHLLFGSPGSTVDLSTLHPEPVQIFRLWQFYLDNVNPLLKVTHTPSLQGRIIEAAGDIHSIDPVLEALMFGIYCISVLSLPEDDCESFFGSTKVDLLTRYQFGCKQALSNCKFLLSGDRECLTALYFYLVSVRPTIVPHSLSSMLGVAIRIAQRIGIYSESELAKCSILEAEMRRRLWWSLMLFDARISEMADFKTGTLNPTWDCRIPLIINDSDLRQEMKEQPLVHGISAEALFAVVRSEVGDYIRHSIFYLDFSGPALKPLARQYKNTNTADSSELVALESLIEDKYLRSCNPENPLHYMTMWMTRAQLAKFRLVEHYARYSRLSGRQAEVTRDAAMSYAITMLECDTKIMTSSLTRGFIWFVRVYFPFPAYFQIVQNLRRRPASTQSGQAWEAMNANFEAHFLSINKHDGPLFDGAFFEIFAQHVLEAWEARRAIVEKPGELLETPKIVRSLRERLAQLGKSDPTSGGGQSSAEMKAELVDLPQSMPVDFPSDNLYAGVEGEDMYGGNLEAMYSDMPGLGVDMNQLAWSRMGWDYGTNTQW